jgi:hypothetical protein
MGVTGPQPGYFLKRTFGEEKLNVGHESADATITLAEVDQQLSDYIEFYRSCAKEIAYPGMLVSGLPAHLDRIHVRLDYRDTSS